MPGYVTGAGTCTAADLGLHTSPEHRQPELGYHHVEEEKERSDGQQQVASQIL